MKTVAFYTLGCKVNSYDTEAMIALFEESGYGVVNFSEVADIYIINTCTVTNAGDKKSRQAIRKARNKNENALVVATGCYAQVAPQDVAKILGVNLVLGTKERKNIVSEVEKWLDNCGVGEVNVSDVFDDNDFENLFVTKTDNHTRAFLKIQDGCDRFCAYCIIPYARGKVRSRKVEDVLIQAEMFGQNGFKEIVLAGIHVASYGKDIGDTDLISLVEKIHNDNIIERIRFSSLEPTLITNEFVARLKQLPKICEHFHLSLQSGCDKTLERMNRTYSVEQYENAANLLKSAYKNVSLTTDIIVGFPGETEEDFNETYEFAKKIGFSKINVFPYSKKTGTKAALFEEQISPQVKNLRCEKLILLSQNLEESFAKKFVGENVSVLYEQLLEDNKYCGYTSEYIKVLTVCAENLINQTKTVKILSSNLGILTSEILQI